VIPVLANYFMSEAVVTGRHPLTNFVLGQNISLFQELFDLFMPH
jgi:hypothetical protein